MLLSTFLFPVGGFLTVTPLLLCSTVLGRTLMDRSLVRSFVRKRQHAGAYLHCRRKVVEVEERGGGGGGHGKCGGGRDSSRGKKRKERFFFLSSHFSGLLIRRLDPTPRIISTTISHRSRTREQREERRGEGSGRELKSDPSAVAFRPKLIWGLANAKKEGRKKKEKLHNNNMNSDSCLTSVQVCKQTGGARVHKEGGGDRAAAAAASGSCWPPARQPL